MLSCIYKMPKMPKGFWVLIYTIEYPFIYNLLRSAIQKFNKIL